MPDSAGSRSVWSDYQPVNSRRWRHGFPTQKPIDSTGTDHCVSCPPSGHSCSIASAGSGTTAEAAERLGRRWIGIDNGKYAVHLARKRLIQLHGQPRPRGENAIRVCRVRKVQEH